MGYRLGLLLGNEAFERRSDRRRRLLRAGVRAVPGLAGAELRRHAPARGAVRAPENEWQIDRPRGGDCQDGTGRGGVGRVVGWTLRPPPLRRCLVVVVVVVVVVLPLRFAIRPAPRMVAVYGIDWCRHPLGAVRSAGNIDVRVLSQS